MARGSAIEWTEGTWNPVTGCTKVSAGCANCYAERMAKRLQAMGQPNYAGGFRPAVHEHLLETPLTWRTPQMIFVNSMGDLFHEVVPDEFIERAFETMVRASWHTFQILTKRSERLSAMAPGLPWPPNVWMGVTVERADYGFRIADLATTAAHVKFASMEPLLGPMDGLDIRPLDWVIAGGESGPGARPMDPEWVRGVRTLCRSAGVPFFFKQWGGTNRKKAGRILDGRTWDEYPTASVAQAADAHTA